MNKIHTHKKLLTALAAICSSVFLLAACEPQSGQQTEDQTEQETTTYGEPDRETSPPESQDPASQDPASEDPAMQESPDAQDQESQGTQSNP